jgi:D-alanyl-lipoteichoic acid acyltransferase DltB (MBOAT superfamily)
MMITCKYFYFGYEVHDGKLENLPNFLEFLGYIYFYPTAAIGPTFDFTTYQNFIYQRKHYATIPPTLRVAIKDFATGVLFVLPVIFLGNKMNIKIFGTPEIQNYNLLEKFVILNTFPFISR